MLTYTSKRDTINKGIIKKQGKIYKLSVLEIWHSKGYLDYEFSKYSADERLECGLKLALDFHIINRANIHSSHIINTRVDANSTPQSVALLDAMHRYNKAIKAVPAEFWPIVRQICIEDKDLTVSKHLSERQKSYVLYMNRIDLCRGLDRIIGYCNQKLKMNRNDNFSFTCEKKYCNDIKKYI